MVVMVIENASNRLRGELTRWLLETKAGVFVGNINAMVRIGIWEKVCQDNDNVNAIMIYSSNNEQGFRMEMYGDPYRSVVDFDGIQLMKIQQNQ